MDVSTCNSTRSCVYFWWIDLRRLPNFDVTGYLKNHQVSQGLSCCETFACQCKKSLRVCKQKLKSGTRCHNGKSTLHYKLDHKSCQTNISSIINPTSIKHGEWITSFFSGYAKKSSPPKKPCVPSLSERASGTRSINTRWNVEAASYQQGASKRIY